MLDTLQDIRQRLLNGEYKNEEHVRLSLVARVVQELGWNIWSPTEVYTEFKATELEDNTRVDVALFAHNFAGDTIFIECKNVGRIGDDLAKVERQLRDYNRNHSALFTIITDGQHWRFYYALTAGEFAQKLFARLDLVQDDLTEAAEAMQRFLAREAIMSGAARHAAESYLLLSRKERVMKDLLPEAEKRITQPPFPSLPDALVALLAAKGLVVTRAEAVAFLAGDALPKPVGSVEPIAKPASPNKDDTPRVEGNKNSQQPVFYLKLWRGDITATAQWSDPQRTQLIVASGSTAALKATASLSKGYAALRQKLIEDGILVSDGNVLRFMQPVAFDNATQAGAVICGYSANGRTFWKDANGKILGDYVTS
ncbi:DUF4357 domain-containing protein [Hymenobacter sp. CRA2]|uniref:DUF4357 domain-containing protein n=1 Tax=Hymenobacter sp. CRA2 TaxID=1955620 RepID=UPI0009C7B68D|nr:DUF4357 domain-containing protein [Hymenobacter sp. CRA2]OON67365.1 hypothetical protein B0919_18025 [Hymenobacter sp. CRA2]